MSDETRGCPVDHGRIFPEDGAPLLPSPTLTAWREEAPAVRIALRDGGEGWLVTRHDLARAVLGDDRFSIQPRRAPAVAAWEEPQPYIVGPDASENERAMAESDLLALDGEAHARMRRMLTSHFALKAVRARREEIAEVVRSQIAYLRSQGAPVNLTSHFADRVSAFVHCRMIGIPDDRAEEYLDLFFSRKKGDGFAFAREIIALRARDPGEDIISRLLTEELEPHEVLGLAVVLMIVGRDSVAHMIATGAATLLAHPDQLALVRDDPALLPGAVEELIRYGTADVTVLSRTATEDLVLDGLSLRAGETVVVATQTANRDPGRFPDPDELDVSRDAFGQLGFGYGVHGCIGQNLGRAEIVEALTQLFDALPGLRVVETDLTTPQPFPHGFPQFGPVRVIVAW